MEPWRIKLAAGEPDAAWNLFIDRYRGLIFSTVRQIVRSEEDVDDVFAEVCQLLAVDDLARLKRYTTEQAGAARFSTWLATVVHNLTVDGVRKRDGRRRTRVPAALSPVQQEIFQLLFIEKRSHSDAYEHMRARAGAPPRFASFGGFLQEVTGTYRVLEGLHANGALHYLPALPPANGVESHQDQLELGELRRCLADMLDGLPADERLALQLFVIDELPAPDVARLVGWPNAKAVYNRVYRALAVLRDRLQQQGVGRRDL
ncbi:MAG: RNA polymerase sigma factor [Longimicrobiales bacterium]